MRYFDNGAFFTVTCSSDDVYHFACKWPCSGLPWRPISFQFDATNGDLVDVRCNIASSTFDGPALEALSQDAYQYGLKRRSRDVPRG